MGSPNGAAAGASSARFAKSPDRGLPRTSGGSAFMRAASRLFPAWNQADSVASVFAIASLVAYVLTHVLFRFGGVAELLRGVPSLDPRAVGEGVALACALVSLALRKSRMPALAFGLVVVALALLFYSAFQTGINYLVQGYIILMALAHEELGRLLRAYLLALLPSFVIVVLLALAGAIPNLDSIPNSRLVFSFGFDHPNTCAALLFNAVGASVCVLWDRRGWVFSLALALAAALFSYWTLSANAATVLNLLLAVACLAGHVWPAVREGIVPRRVWRISLVAAPALLLAAMLLCCALYDQKNPLVSLMDGLTHYRPRYAHGYFVRNGGFTMLGRKYVTTSFHHTGLPFQNVDSGYCFLPLVHGIAATVALAVTYVLAVLRAPRRERHLSLWSVLLLGMVFLVVESFGLNLVSCFPLIIMSRAFVWGEERAASAGVVREPV